MTSPHDQDPPDSNTITSERLLGWAAVIGIGGGLLAVAYYLLLQGSLLVRHAPAYVSDAFCASRLGRDWGSVPGTLPSGLDTAAIVERATPTLT